LGWLSKRPSPSISLPAKPGSGFFVYSNFVIASKRSTKPVTIDTVSATAERVSRVIPVPPDCCRTKKSVQGYAERRGSNIQTNSTLHRQRKIRLLWRLCAIKFKLQRQIRHRIVDELIAERR
jgi:hypothetical protein